MTVTTFEEALRDLDCAIERAAGDAFSELGCLGLSTGTRKALGIIDELVDTSMMQPDDVFLKVYSDQVNELRITVSSMNGTTIDVVNAFISKIYERAGMIAAL